MRLWKTCLDWLYKWILLLSSLAFIGDCSSLRCGDTIKGKDFTNGSSLLWPANGGNYQNGEFCIWFLEAHGNYSINLVVYDVQGETGPAGDCNDYFEVRDGGPESPIILKTCNLNSPTNISSSSRWMTVAFVSNQDVTNTGFNATYSSFYSGVSTASNPVDTCQGFNMRCRNQVCVKRGYLCDGLNDCGCTGAGCDEHKCGGLNISDASMVACGVVVGCVSFIIIFVAIGVLELILKKRAIAEKKREAEEEEKRKRRPKPRRKTPVPLDESLKLTGCSNHAYSNSNFGSRPTTPLPPAVP